MRDRSQAAARQYARALVGLAEQRGGDEPLRLRGELRQLGTLVERHPELRAALEHPGVDPESRRRVLVAIAESGGASELLTRLVGLLGTRDHVHLLPAIAEIYAALVNASRGIVPAEVMGAVPLTQKQERALAEALKGTTGGELELTAKVDPRVLGGLRVTMGGKTYDGTVRGRLAALRRTLASGS
ncbi:MAG: ATP synthase F1 subunit delta [Acidobacteria bacterium]|nr:ATP synthase F1 subunit delta [Acidobacteriota bacterium]